MPAGGPVAPADAAPRPFPRLIAAVEVALTSGFPTQLAVGAALLGAGMKAFDAGGGLSMPFVITLWLADSVVLLALVAVFLQLSGQRWTPLLFGGRASGREAWLGVALIPVLFGTVVGLMALVGWLWPALHNVPTNPFEALIRSPRDAAVLALVAVLSGGLKEEVQRAFVLRRFDEHLGGARVGLVVFSLAFGAGHFIQGWDVGLVTTILGFAWGVLYLRRRSIVASAVSHAGFNLAQIIQFVVVGPS